MDGMASAITAYRQANTIQQVQYALTAQILDQARAQGEALVGLMQTGANPQRSITDPNLARIVDEYA